MGGVPTRASKPAPRLGVLGELGRYPVLINAIIHSLKYDWHISKKSDPTSLVSGAYREMQALEIDCWLKRINYIKNYLELIP